MQLPQPRGPLSEFLLERLVRPVHAVPAGPAPTEDPLTDEDTALALYLSYELHYEQLDGVDPEWEWEPSRLAFRARLEAPFTEALLAAAGRPEAVAAADVVAGLEAVIAGDDGPSVARYIGARADLGQVREFVVQRSAYLLKEAEPQTWVIPRIAGRAKAALVEILADEYGGGEPERMHQNMWADTMRALELDDAPGAYLDRLPAPTLTTVNVLSLFGLHSRWRAAAVGHLAVTEMTSSIPNRRYGNGLRRLGMGAAATDYFDEHVEADAVHEAVAAHDLAGALARDEPALAGDIVFGARALVAVERAFAEHVLGAWERGASSLRAPLPATVRP